MKRKWEGCGAGATERACGYEREAVAEHICAYLCVEPWWREGEGVGRGSKEMAGEGQDEEMGDGWGGSGWWRGRGEDK